MKLFLLLAVSVCSVASASPKGLPVSKVVDFGHHKLTLNLPSGDYTFPTDKATLGNVHTDGGWFCVRPLQKPGGVEACKAAAERTIIQHLDGLGPDEKKKQQRRAKMKEVTFGSWSGYKIEGVNSSYGFFSNGTVVLQVSRSLEKGRISETELPKIIAAIEVVN